jgi:hypothetical protein
MGKKCAPGVFCIENMTLIALMVAVGIAIVVFVQMQNKEIQIINKIPKQDLVMSGSQYVENPNIFNNPHQPPLKNNSHFSRPNGGDVRGGIPINIKTRSSGVGGGEYQQMGILTKPGNPENLILPLMGRQTMSGRDKWNYYTISNSGSVNTRLPVSVKGKSCTSEYGCDDIMNGEQVYVEGYNDTFKVTKYENGEFQYIPVL